MISVVLVNFNEAENLDKCLKSVLDFADEIVVLDLGSTDGSLQTAKKYEAKIYHHDFVNFVELVRDYSISKSSSDWILILDPDEEIPENLKNKLKEVMEQNKVVAVNIPRKNIFFGKWISHSNWWPDRHIRFFKRGKVTWDKRIHRYPKVFGEVLNLEAKEDLAIMHYGYKYISEFVDRQNRYSGIEAENLYEEGERFSWSLFFWKPIREFLVRYIKHAGFLDGFYGFALTILMMAYQLEVMIKLWEWEKKA